MVRALIATIPDHAKTIFRPFFDHLNGLKMIEKWSEHYCTIYTVATNGIKMVKKWSGPFWDPDHFSTIF